MKRNNRKNLDEDKKKITTQLPPSSPSSSPSSSGSMTSSSNVPRSADSSAAIFIKIHVLFYYFYFSLNLILPTKPPAICFFASSESRCSKVPGTLSNVNIFGGLGVLRKAFSFHDHSTAESGILESFIVSTRTISSCNSCRKNHFKYRKLYYFFLFFIYLPFQLIVIDRRVLKIIFLLTSPYHQGPNLTWMYDYA